MGPLHATRRAPVCVVSVLVVVAIGSDMLQTPLFGLFFGPCYAILRPMQSLPTPLSFYFLRHGETDWNAIQRIQGQTDIPLNPKGLQQAQLAADLLKGVAIDKIIASPLKRAAATAAIVQAQLGSPLHHDEHLVEQHYGSFEGRFRHDIEAELGPEAKNLYWQFLPHDAEPLDAFTKRIATRIEHHLQAEPNKTLLFVGHGGAMGALTYALGLGANHRFANAVPYRFSNMGEGWRMEALRPDYTCIGA